jgi:dihydrolipoamide dehydrogenase
MTYDLAILGSGPGGYSAAVRAGQYGLRTAIIEKDPKLGGCCLHVGCVPTKALLHMAEVWEHFVHAEQEGIHCENPRLNYPRIIENKDGIVSKHAKGVEMLMRKNKVDVIKGYGRLRGGGRIEVSGDGGLQTVEARNIIIATGSEARMLPGLTPDPERILTNIEILKMTSVPESLLIIGAGAVGVEFASIFNRFGSQVTISRDAAAHGAGRGRGSLAGTRAGVQENPASASSRAKASRHPPAGGKGVQTFGHARQRQGRGTGGGRACWWRWDASRTPRYRPGVHAGRAVGPRLHHRRPYQRTAEPGVYAIGDVVAGTPQLAHVASMEGMVAVAHIAGRPALNPSTATGFRAPPTPNPGIGSVGLTEAQARAAGYKVKIGKFPFVANSKATIVGSHDGFVKVVADEKLRRDSGRPYHRTARPMS